MSHIYVDSSILVSLLFQEKGWQKYSKSLSQCEGAYSSYLLEAEVYASAKREGLKLTVAKEFIESLSLVIPDRSLHSEYFRIFEFGYCRGADACHIATALYLDPDAKNVHFMTADQSQAKMAKVLGFQLFP